jgi:hypothetical protein
MIDKTCLGSVLRIFGHELFDLGDQLWDAEWLWHNIVLQDWLANRALTDDRDHFLLTIPALIAVLICSFRALAVTAMTGM